MGFTLPPELAEYEWLARRCYWDTTLEQQMETYRRLVKRLVARFDELNSTYRLLQKRRKALLSGKNPDQKIRAQWKREARAWHNAKRTLLYRAAEEHRALFLAIKNRSIIEIRDEDVPAFEDRLFTSTDLYTESRGKLNRSKLDKLQ